MQMTDALHGKDNVVSTIACFLSDHVFMEVGCLTTFSSLMSSSLLTVSTCLEPDLTSGLTVTVIPKSIDLDMVRGAGESGLNS